MYNKEKIHWCGDVIDGLHNQAVFLKKNQVNYAALAHFLVLDSEASYIISYILEFEAIP